ncbi:Protein of unknown function [Gryllus bimaculatus]|nr:Protein of unknown function [Gryllus bimaculatus]
MYSIREATDVVWLAMMATTARDADNSWRRAPGDEGSRVWRPGRAAAPRGGREGGRRLAAVAAWRGVAGRDARGGAGPRLAAVAAADDDRERCLPGQCSVAPAGSVSPTHQLVARCQLSPDKRATTRGMASWWKDAAAVILSTCAVIDVQRISSTVWLFYRDLFSSIVEDRY